MVRFVHNLYLALALLVTPILVGVELVFLAWMPGDSLISLATQLEQLHLVLLSLAILTLFGSRSVPVRVYLPAALVALWSAIGLWPLFPPFREVPGSDLALSTIWLLIVLDQVRVRRKLGANRYGFWQSPFDARDERLPWGRLLVGLPLLSIGVVFYTFLVVVFAALAEVNQRADGFVRFDWSGLYTQHVVYQKNQQRVHLLSMVHLAEAPFYDRILARIPRHNSLVLMEGVTDRDGLMKHNLDYRKPALWLGLEAQGERFNPTLRRNYAVQHADIDLRDLRPQTLEGIQTMARLLDGQLDLDLYRSFADAESFRYFEEEILQLRNDHLMDVFFAHEGRYADIAMPWGGAHLSDIAHRLQQLGYVRMREAELRAIDFWGLLTR